MKDSGRREGEDREEERTNHVSHQCYNASWDEWLFNFWISTLDDQDGNISRNTHNCYFTKHHHNPSNNICWLKSSTLSDVEIVGSYGCWTEALIFKSNLNESVIGNEFDLLSKEKKYTFNATFDNFIERSFLWCHFFVLVSQVLENPFDHGDESNTESSESNRSTIVPNSPFGSFQKRRCFSLSIWTLIEIPHACHGSYDELLKANEECHNPYKSK